MKHIKNKNTKLVLRITVEELVGKSPPFVVMPLFNLHEVCNGVEDLKETLTELKEYTEKKIVKRLDTKRNKNDQMV